MRNFVYFISDYTYQNQKNMWKKPWGYKEGLAVYAGLFLIGLMLQSTIGKINLDVIAYPVNVFVMILFLAVLLIMHLSSKTIYFFRWLSTYQAAVTSMVAMVVIIVVMGLTRQLRPDVEVSGIMSRLGFSQMLSAWSFVLLFTWFIVVLGMVILRRLSRFKLKDIPFILNHVGLFVALLGGILGSADLQRLELTASIGKPEWRVFDRARNLKDLDLAIELNSFTIDEYPPKLMLVDNETGKVLPEGKPINILLEDEVTNGDLLDWHITIEQRIENAARVATEDTVKYVEFHSMGATYAVYVKAYNQKTQQESEGWVSCGSFIFPYKAIRLGDDVSLIMPDREPRRYASDVTIYTESQKEINAVIEVNKPLKVEGWKIYQLSYDESKGKWSTSSVFELVRDPWIVVVYIGIWMMIAGAVCMFVFAPKHKEDKE